MDLPSEASLLEYSLSLSKLTDVLVPLISNISISLFMSLGWNPQSFKAVSNSYLDIKPFCVVLNTSAIARLLDFI
jgi:hypothetical protein